ncbi:hypothetical protein RJ639_040269 [Escallonia herrerae]|uniref:SBP-type domain-containing protein n=1 Tax=Escallonia herrerae TaxID=1293975 RepID=A0AA89BBN7_9ASTE|nr:hypothetical protein RJ639_040269 [Escallonia herrerae]
MQMGSTNSSESLNGLKFGQKIYFEDVGIGVPAKSGGGSSSAGGGGGVPPLTPPKKVRVGVVQGVQPPRCQVEGCKADLSDAKAYYSRHKVCGMHSKSPKVIVAGLEQRFCQQCSRFHQLPEFDQGKRSCRRRLAGHNERRRKPPPGSLLSTRYGGLSSSIFENGSRGGGFLMDFASHRVSGRGPWPNGRASEQLSGNQPTAIGKFVPHPWQINSENPPPDIQGSANRTPYPGPAMSSGGCFTGVSDSSCALSLLSNQPWGSRSQPSSLGENTLLHSEGPPMIQAAATHGAAVSHFSSSSWGFKGNEAAASSSHEMHPHLGLGQVSHSATGHYSGELELAQHGGRQYMEVEHSRAYDSSAQHMHWSL